MNSIRRIFCTLVVFVIAAATLSVSAFAAENEEIFTPNLPVWDGTVAESFAGGDGTKDNPYLISDGSELALLMQKINSTEKESAQKTAGEYYRLTNDILLNDISDFYEWDDENAPENLWTPGGAVVSYTPIGFAGYFDGNNYDIIGMYVNRNAQYNGLFGYVYNGQIKNLGVKYSYISGGNNTAAIAGYARASSARVYFSGCKVDNCVIKGKNSLGGIVGYPESYTKELYIDKCSVSGSVSGNNYVGGIAGLAVAYGVKYNNDGKYAINITNCENRASVSGKTGIGGIVGSSKDFVSAVGASGNIAMLIENCVNNGNIAATSEHIGAIIGTAGPHDREDASVITHIKNCYGNNVYATAVYGYSLATTDDSTSKLYIEAQMKDKDNFGSFDFEARWNMSEVGPSLKILGDIAGDGKLTAEDAAILVALFAGADNYSGSEFASSDLNGDGEYNFADINFLMEYFRNKGAKTK